MAARILGMGDVVEMVRTAQQEFDQQQLAETEERLRKGEFTLDDFRNQLSQIARPGMLQKFMGLMPGMGEMNKMLNDVDADGDMKRLFGMIDSMTPAEKRNPNLIDISRRQRIAAGSGVQPQEVNELVKQFDAMASIMTVDGRQGHGRPDEDDARAATGRIVGPWRETGAEEAKHRQAIDPERTR